MAKHKPDVKDRKKGSQLVIRLDKAERDAFVTLCERLDTSAAREIRRFMREFVAARSGEGSDPVGSTETVVIAATVVEQSNESAASQEPSVDAEVPEFYAEKPRKKPAHFRLRRDKLQADAAPPG